MTVSVLKAGAFTSIQDAGRPCWRHLGVPRAGAADLVSLALANHCAGNKWDAPALECTLSGPVLKFARDTEFALSGADMPAALNGAPITFDQHHVGKSGDELVLGAAHIGARTYIAFSGGLAAELFLSSAATYPPAELGGLEGRCLRDGDVIKIDALAAISTIPPPADLRPAFARDWILRAMPGPDANHFDAKTRRQFFSKPFTIDRRSDRMGMRLNGPVIRAGGGAQMNSGPVFPGTVQCPESGAPFLLLCDAQTLGGYPRIAQIIIADLPLAGQMRPGDQVWFRQVTVDEARKMTAQREALLASFIDGFRFG